MLGKNIDTYEITQEVGRGSAATVYVARQQPVGRYVAIKMFDHLTPDSTARLTQLFDQIESLDHVNILPLYASGQSDERLYWVMRYLSTGSLRTRSRAAPEQIDRWVAQIASALDYAHQHSLIHGNLKPSNVLLDHAGNAFVCDFGVAQIVGPSSDAYPLPEQRREFTPDVRSDVYALGALTYELVTNRAPVRASPHGDDQPNRPGGLPPLPSSFNAKLTPGVDAAIMKALSIEPAKRYASAQEFAEAYAQARESAQVAQPGAEKQPRDQKEAAAARHAGAQPSTARTIPRAQVSVDRRWIAGRIVGLLILIGLIGLLSSQSSTTLAPATDMPTAIATTLSVMPTASPVPTTLPTSRPSLAPTPTISASAIIFVTPTITPSPSATRAPATVRAVPTPVITLPVSIEPLSLLIPRRESQTQLALLFSTHIRPENAGPIGLLSISIPPIEPLVVNRQLAQVGSGEQTLAASIAINCNLLPEPIETRQLLLIIRNPQGSVIYAQALDYIKTWCQ